MRRTLVLLLSFLATMATPSWSATNTIVLEDFSAPKLSWRTINDPVMGGTSSGTFRIDGESGLGIYEGRVNIVPRINGPGFIKLGSFSPTFPDISTCRGIELVVRSTTSDYQGYRISFGNEHDPVARMKFIRGHKAHFFLNPNANNSTFQTIVIPFLEFSLDWDPTTGDAVVPCSEDKQFCPDLETLQGILRLGIMGEGVQGSVYLEIKSISAVQCGGERMGFLKEGQKESAPAYQSPEESSSSSKTNPTINILFLVVVVVVCGAALYWKRQQGKAQGRSYYQAVETKETSPQEAGYSLELS